MQHAYNMTDFPNSHSVHPRGQIYDSLLSFEWSVLRGLIIQLFCFTLTFSLCLNNMVHWFISTSKQTLLLRLPISVQLYFQSVHLKHLVLWVGLQIHWLYPMQKDQTPTSKQVSLLWHCKSSNCEVSVPEI